MSEKILGVLVDTEPLAKILSRIKPKKPLSVVSVNPELVVMSQKDDKLRFIINEADIHLPDGVGIALMVRKVKERISGIDFMLAMCEEAAKRGWRVYLYGAKPGVAQKAKEKLEKQFVGIKVVGVSDGYGDDPIDDIKKKKAEIIFVGLGMPRQEEWIAAHQYGVRVAVGGSFDVISGEKKRAPRVWRKLKLEWLYRLLKEPSRIGRQLNLVWFVFLVIFRRRR